MTKRELVKWLEAKRERTLSELTSKYSKAVKELKSQVIVESGLPAVAEQMETLIDQAMELWSEWKGQQSEADGIRFKRYSYFLGNIGKYTSSKEATLRQLVDEEFVVWSPNMARLENEYKATREKTRCNYDNVIAVVNSIPKSKQATEYLEGLGFDLMEIEPPKKPVTALTVKIDKSYLFLQKAS